MITLVTGATGNVGSRVVRALRERGMSARAFVRDAARAAERLGSGVELALGDFADAESVRRALDGVDVVFLACGNQPSQAELESTAIEACAAAGVRRIVKLSAFGAEIGSPLAFWDMQGRAERSLRESGVPAVVLRPTNYMTNLLGAADAIRATGKLFIPAGDARLAMIDPADVAAAAVVTLTADGHEGATYTLTGPESITYADVARELSHATGRPIEYVDVPDEAARQGLLAAGMPPWLAEQLVILFGLVRAGGMDRPTDAVRALTGRAPRTFAQFAREHAAFFAASAGGLTVQVAADGR
jgi:uncharacterized protein YbjT (DUF2867 family)